MSSVRSRFAIALATSFLGATLCVPRSAAKPQTFTGTVSDAMCGANI